MQQRNAYTPAAAAAAINGSDRDWSGEITPLVRLRAPLDTGIGGMSENEMSGSGMRNDQWGDVRPGTSNDAMNGMTNMNGMNNANNMSGMQPRRNGGLDMQNNLPDEVIESPTSTAEVYAGSTKAMLRRNLGNYVVATFLVGTQNTVSWEGILYDVGNDYVTIYQPGRDRYIVNDIYSLKYTEFYDVRRRELCDRLLQEQGWTEENRWSPSR